MLETAKNESFSTSMFLIKILLCLFSDIFAISEVESLGGELDLSNSKYL